MSDCFFILFVLSYFCWLNNSIGKFKKKSIFSECSFNSKLKINLNQNLQPKKEIYIRMNGIQCIRYVVLKSKN